MIDGITQNLSMETASSVDAYMATWIAISLIAFLLIIVPLIERIPKIGECISHRWIVVTVTTTLMVAVVINFEHLDNGVRGSIIIGGFIVSIMYILLRSLEKALAKGWSFGVKRIEGDWEHKRVEVEMDPTPPQEHTQEHSQSQSQSQEHTQSQSQESESEKSEDKHDASFKNS